MLNIASSFFLKHAPLIILLSVLNLHAFGYLLEKYFFPNMELAIWMFIAAVDMAFAYKCGLLVQELSKRRYQDFLTGLYNRSFLYYVIDDKHRSISSSLSMLMLDMDNFKMINDSYGHDEGDHVLVQIASIIKTSIRADDIPIRWGGDEFIIALPQTSLKDAKATGELIQSRIDCYKFGNKAMLPKITVSIGAASIETASDLDILIQRADKALYKAKEEKNKICIFDI